MSNWTLFSNHGHVLVCLARDPDARLRDVAINVGITERAVQKIVRDLQDGGMVSVTKVGRRNCYRIHKKASLRHDLEAHCTLRDLNSIIKKKPESTPGTVKPLSANVLEARSVKPKPTGIASQKPKPKKSTPAKASKSKSKTSKAAERQQGSLF